MDITLKHYKDTWEAFAFSTIRPHALACGVHWEFGCDCTDLALEVIDRLRLEPDADTRYLWTGRHGCAIVMEPGIVIDSSARRPFHLESPPMHLQTSWEYNSGAEILSYIDRNAVPHPFSPVSRTTFTTILHANASNDRACVVLFRCWTHKAGGEGAFCGRIEYTFKTGILSCGTGKQSTERTLNLRSDPPDHIQVKVPSIVRIAFHDHHFGRAERTAQWQGMKDTFLDFLVAKEKAARL
ncbi:hypothetical protein B0H16DRAFT_1749095 [Mycena metata]|uniref:Uncharacterized protein n=1 Tax=Mycena metata TaxID=1033252 RepID=A0AAD7GLF5_9AGAR|nr:hypothetical protein B0H16DRAFT_1749095 [Mycena metata]